MKTEKERAIEMNERMLLLGLIVVQGANNMFLGRTHRFSLRTQND